MPDPTADRGPSFVTREPVVAAGGSTVGAVGLAYAIMEMCQAFDWQQFTAAQSKAVIGIVVVVAALGSSFLAAQKVTPQHEVERQVLEAWVAEPPYKAMADIAIRAVVDAGPQPSVAARAAGIAAFTAPQTLSYGDQLVADAIAAQQLAGTQPTGANIVPDDPSRPPV